MLSVIITIPVTFIVITLLGYLLHKALHQKWMGRLYRSHLVHHYTLYPPEDYQSYEYRDAGKDNTTFIFTAAAIPLAIIPVALFILHILSLKLLLTIAFSMAIFGMAHDYLHDAFHIRGYWLTKYKWFNKLVDLHYVHHIFVQKNLGIYSFFWDRLFGSFKEKQ